MLWPIAPTAALACLPITTVLPNPALSLPMVDKRDISFVDDDDSDRRASPRKKQGCKNKRALQEDDSTDYEYVANGSLSASTKRPLATASSSGSGASRSGGGAGTNSTATANGPVKHSAVPINTPSSPDHILDVFTMNGTNVKKAVEVISTVLSPATLKFSSSGIVLSGYDVANVACVVLSLKASSFHTYYFDPAHEHFTFNVDVSKLNKTLAPASQRGKLRFCVKRDNPNDLIVVIPDKTVSFMTKIQNQEIQNEHKLDYLNAVQSINFGASVLMSATQFYRIIKQLNMHGMMVRFTTDFEKLYLLVEGNNDTLCTVSPVQARPPGQGSGSSHAEEDDDDGTALKFLDLPTKPGEDHQDDESVSEQYALRYLVIFAKASSLSNHVRISFGLNKPIVMAYAIGDEGTLNYILAAALPTDGDEAGPD